MHFDSKIRC